MLKRISLVGEQKKVLTLSPNGPIQIKGAAGSGKTTVALYRACHMMDSHTDMFQPTKVAIFTFNKSLSGYLSSLTDNLNDNSYSGLNIINFHKWAYAFISQYGVNLYGKTIFDREIKKIVTSVVASLIPKHLEQIRILTKDADFYLEEISWIKGKNIRSVQEYIDTKRVGRGTSDRVTTKDKVVLWEVFNGYRDELKRIGKYDFDDYAILCLDILGKIGSSFNEPFTHIVVDEAQDLSKAQMTVLSKLISPTTNSLTVIADAAQRIYKSGFTWKEVGINVKGGRTIEFKKNYRNTEFIAKAATSLLEHDDDPGEFTKVEIGHRKGVKPELIKAPNIDIEYSYIIKKIKAIRSISTMESICLLHRTNQGLRKLRNLLESNGLQPQEISRTGKISYNDSNINLATMQSVKGLEFDHVFICDLVDENLPILAGFSEPDDELHISTERRLLYTCMTRAVNSLVMCYSGKPSRYFTEISSETIEKITL